MYFDRETLVSKDIQAKIEKIRANHNTKRTEFTMPIEFNHILTDYKVLGLIEGEGSFFIMKKGLVPRFELELTASQESLLVSMKSYLESKIELFLTENQISQIKRGGINIRNCKAKSQGKASVRLEITGVNFLHLFFNAYLREMKFLSKKGLDFETFCEICASLHKKAHLNNEEVAEYLLNLAKGMNNARLTNNKKSSLDA